MHKITSKILRNMPGQESKRSFLSKFFLNEDGMLLPDSNYEEISRRRNAYLQDAYKGETAYIVSCGPSMDIVWSDKLKGFLADKLVISIKQAQELAPDISDFHLYNEVRMKQYKYHNDTVRISASQYMIDYPSHIHYPIREYKWDSAIFVTNDYENSTLEKSYERPWGIGIMFEVGLFLPIHLGCRRVVIMGFDMNCEGKFHFYDSDKGSDSAYYKVDKEEFPYAIESAGRYAEWAASMGVEVKLYSPLSELPIPRLNDFNAFERYGRP